MKTESKLTDCRGCADKSIEEQEEASQEPYCPICWLAQYSECKGHDMNNADKQAAELLPCIVKPHEPCSDSWRCFTCELRPAVAAALRERDERITGLLKEAKFCRLDHERLPELEERIAALEAERDALAARLKELEEFATNRTNAEQRRK